MKTEKKAENDKKKQTERKWTNNKFVRGRWFPLLGFIFLLVIVIVVVGLFGFRITYAPEMENSWDAISAVAAWVSVIVAALSAGASFAAIWTAIRVPQKIADRQDKIALFEKRYDALLTYNKCRTFALLLVPIKEKGKVNDVFYTAFKNIADEPPLVPLSDYSSLWKVQVDVVRHIDISSYLFDKSVGEYLRLVSGALFDILVSVYEKGDISLWEDKKAAYCALLGKDNYNEMREKMKSYLKLG